MTDIDVEAVDSLEATVEAPEYVLYGGKGGVGKTTCAAATALASAREGTATLAVSTDPAHSLSDVLDADVPSDPARIREDVPLYGAEIDPEAMTEGPFAGGGGDGAVGADDGSGGRPGGGAGGLGGLDALLGGDDPLTGAMPGADEAAAFQLLLRYMDDDRFDRVVVDTAPTGHTLRLLELPEMMDSMVGRLLSLRDRLSGMAESLGGLFGGGGGGDEADLEAGVDDLRTLSERVERLRAALQDPARTDFRVVMVPEEMSVAESERLISRLAEFDIPVGTVVVNRVMQPLAHVADVDPDWFVAPDLDGCEFCQRRWAVQRDALARAQDVFRGHEVKRVPLFADEVRGEAMLRVVAACLD
jgi:arsenite-transporting ATPase